MAAGYIVTVNNQSAVSCLVDCITATDTINNSTSSVPIASLESITFIINSAATGYVIKGRGSGFSSTIAAATVAAHATTMNPWVAREIVASGGAVTFTDIADAPYVGATVSVYMNAAHIWTDGAVFNVQGNATYTAVIGDWIDIVARSAVDAFDVFIRKADGTAVAASLSLWNIAGLTYANNATDPTNDIDIAVGSARDSTNAVDIVLAAALIKRLDAAWVVGTNQGGLDTGAIGNSDYYIWLIKRSDTGVVDVLFSLSSTAPTMPTNYDYKRLIGWFKRVGATIVLFDTYQIEGGGLELNWDTPTVDIDLAATLSTARRTDAVKVPLNFSVIAHLNVYINDALDSYYVVYCPDQADLIPAAGTGNVVVRAASVLAVDLMRIRTSAAGLIAARGTQTADEYKVVTNGFSWARRN